MKRKPPKQSDDGIKLYPSFDRHISSSKALIAQADCMDDRDEARDHYKKAYQKCEAALTLKPNHLVVKAQIKYIKKELMRIKEAQDLDKAEEFQARHSVKLDPRFGEYIKSARALVAQADCMDDRDEARDHYKKAYQKSKVALTLKPDHLGVKAQIKYIKKELMRIKEAQDLDEAEKSQAIYVQEESEHSDDIDNVQIKRKIPKKQVEIEQVQVDRSEKAKTKQDTSELVAAHHEPDDVYDLHRISVKKYIEFVEGMIPGEYEDIHVMGGEGENFNLYHPIPTPMDLG